MDLQGLTLRSGLRLIGLIAHQLTRAAQCGDEMDRYVRQPARQVDREALALIATAEYRWRRHREKHFPDHLLGEPAWDMLLDLFISEVHCKPISVTSACVGASVAPTTALRYLEALIKEGLVRRQQDVADMRRSFVRLTDAGRCKMEAYLLAQLGDDDRPVSWTFPASETFRQSWNESDTGVPSSIQMI